MDISQYLDPLMERLTALADIIKERLEGLPYYPYSAWGIAGLIALLLLLMLFSRKRSTKPNIKKAKVIQSTNRARTHVSGMAVGLSSHEDFSYENASVRVPPNTPPAPQPAPGHTPPVADILLTKPEPAAPVSPPPVAPQPAASQAPVLDSDDVGNIISACEGQFTAMYAEMSEQKGFVTDFSRFKTEVVKHLKDAVMTRRAVSELKMTPKGLVLAQMASVAGSFLQSGRYHIGMGQMNMNGDEHLAAYRWALTAMLDNGLATKEDVQNKLDYMEKKVSEVG